MLGKWARTADYLTVSYRVPTPLNGVLAPDARLGNACSEHVCNMNRNSPACTAAGQKSHMEAH
jgi:hypothetical protein